jgi:hypothetical protein
VLGVGNELRGPVVLFDREGWLVVVANPAEVAVAIEANDVEAGEYVGFDADGRVLELSVRYDADRPGWRSAQEIEVGVTGGRLGDDDRRALLAEAVGNADEGTPVSNLLEAARQRQRLDLQAPKIAALLRQRLGLESDP